jgi:ketosteroid isomerase-like protein
MTALPRVISGDEDRALLPSPLAALSAFYTAFNGRDLAGVSANWSQGAEAAMDNPLGGIKRGWEEIRSVYARIFDGPARVYVEFYDFTLHEHGEVFYAVGRERGELVTPRATVALAIRTSRIYRRIDKAWRQVHHHGSIDDPELLARYQAAVRGD